MTKQLAKTDGYKTLVKKIQSELSELDFFVKRRTAESYWKVGKFIHEHLLENKHRANYGHNLLERLAQDINRDSSTLTRAIKFYRTYPILARGHELNWTHYRTLITIKDKGQRKDLEEHIILKNWDAQELQKYLSRKRLQESLEKDEDRPIIQLPVIRSRLYTYQVLEPSYIHPVKEHLVIDLGFKFLTHTEIKGIRLKQAEIVESEKTGERYSFKHSDATLKELYTYKALVERVVDADTIWLNIDLGFSCWSRQKVRFRGIDAPELSTIKGQKAKEFVEARLKEVKFIIVKTHASDKYERYLADIFYGEGESEPAKVLDNGVFLNQELLDNFLAAEMRD